MQRAGREDRIGEPMSASLEACVRESTAAIESATNRPYVLYGHSLGGFLTYHVAQRIEQLKLRPPECVFISGIGPDMSADGYDTAHQEYEHFIGRQLVRDLGSEIDEDTLQDMLQHSRKAYEQDLHLYFHHDAGDLWAPLSVPIHVFYGTLDGFAPKEAVRKWQRYTTHSLNDVEVEGDHMFIEGVGRKTVAQYILKHLETLVA